MTLFNLRSFRSLSLAFVFVSVFSSIAFSMDPGQFTVSAPYSLPYLRGIKVDPLNPFKLDFIFDKGDKESFLESEQEKLVRYFLAALTIPEEKLWVNLSPYEPDRIIDEKVAVTDIGQTLLAQDYTLKQLSASLTNPDTQTGKAYWGTRVQEQSDDLSKIWIVPGDISIVDENNVMFIADAELDVDTESQTPCVPLMRQIKADVNNGRNFSELRQMFYSVILAQWFKRKFSDSLYSFYVDKEKLSGVDTVDPAFKDHIFDRYVEAFENGAYNIVKKEKDVLTGRLIKKKYFSGGVLAATSPRAREVADSAVSAELANRFVVISSSMASYTPPPNEEKMWKPLSNVFTPEKRENHKLRIRVDGLKKRAETYMQIAVNRGISLQERQDAALKVYEQMRYAEKVFGLEPETLVRVIDGYLQDLVGDKILNTDDAQNIMWHRVAKIMESVAQSSQSSAVHHNGGVALKGMLDGQDIVKSTAVITAVPEELSGAVGIRFVFTDDPREETLKEILSR